MSPLLKLSSSSAVALKSYLAMASILSAAQCSAAWSRGKGVFPAEATQHSGLSLSSLLGLAPALRDTQCHPESEDGWLREVATIEGSPALPIGLLSQPPRPLARLNPPPSFLGKNPISFLYSASGPGDWQARQPMAAAAWAIPEHTSSSFPLGVRGVQEPAGVPSLRLSSLASYTLFSGHEAQSTEGYPTGDGTLQANHRPFPLPTFFLLFWKCCSPYPDTVKSKQCTLWSWSASNFSEPWSALRKAGESKHRNYLFLQLTTLSGAIRERRSSSAFCGWRPALALGSLSHEDPQDSGVPNSPWNRNPGSAF